MMTDDDYLDDDDIASIAKLGSDSETQSREALESIYTDNNTSHGQRDELQLDGPQAPFTLVSSWLKRAKR